MQKFFGLLIALTILFGNPAFAITAHCNELIAAVQGELPLLDEVDIQNVQNRKGLRQELRVVNPYELQPGDSESLKKLKTLLAEREFTSYFRFHNETTNNLTKKIEDVPAMVKPLWDPQEGFLAKLMIARQAEYTLDLTYYIFDRDDAGHTLIYELQRALARGVSVRLMVDSLGSISSSIHGNPHLKTLLTFATDHAGFVKDPATGKPTNIRATVDVVVFNPITNIGSPIRDAAVKAVYLVKQLGEYLKQLVKGESPKFELKELAMTAWNPNRRSHDKIIIADAKFPSRAVGIIGGRNIANHYYALDPKDNDNFKDAEVLFRNHPAYYGTNNKLENLGEVVSQQYERIYFHRANHRISEGVVGKTLGRNKDMKEMAKAAQRVAVVTKDTLTRIDEDYRSPDFGKKYLTQGFDAAKVNILNDIQNIVNEIMPLMQNDPIFLGLLKNKKLVNNQDILTRIKDYVALETEEINFISPYPKINDGTEIKVKDGEESPVENELAIINHIMLARPNLRVNLFTNSAITSDSPLTQSVVDIETAPRFLQKLDPSVRNRVTVYCWGKLDDATLGGTKHYGKFHFKGVYFKGLKTGMVGTYNKDPRSQSNNSEVSTSVSPLINAEGVQDIQFALKMEALIEDIKANSHVWGSPEYNQIRSSPKLSWFKRWSIGHQQFIYDFLQETGIWKFI
jgi:putative cardiolipin synthase